MLIAFSANMFYTTGFFKNNNILFTTRRVTPKLSPNTSYLYIYAPFP